MYKQYIPIKDEDIKEIWETGLIVLDANVILHLYRYNKSSRENVIKILKNKNIYNKIWIPEIIFQEVLKNRTTVINAQWEKEKSINKVTNKQLGDLKNYIKKNCINEKHPYIDFDKILVEIKSLQDKIKEISQIDKTKNYNFTFENDILLIQIIDIFESKLGDIIKDDDLKDLYAKGKVRFTNNIPPGFGDIKKPNTDCYSDFLIWNQILEKAKDKSNIIFVTDDNKSDWWRKIGEESIGPNPKLLEEFYKKTHKKILFYNSDNFYEYIKDNDVTKSINGILSDDDTKQINITSKRYKMRGFFDSDGSLNPKYLKHKKGNYSKADILKWFFLNYDDPANGVMYVSSEGGYQYFNGGPYYAREEIEMEYPDIDQNLLDSVVSIIEQDGFEWVKIGQY